MHFFYYLSIKYHNHSHFSIHFYAFLPIYSLNLSKFSPVFCNYAYDFHTIQKKFSHNAILYLVFPLLCIFIKITDHQSFVSFNFGGRHTHFFVLSYINESHLLHRLCPLQCRFLFACYKTARLVKLFHLDYFLKLPRYHLSYHQI